MNYPLIHSLVTERLLLRKITLSDRESYFHLFASPEVARYMNWEPHEDLSQTDAALAKLMGRYETGRCYRWGITLAEENTLIGMIELLGFTENDGCTFAYQLAPEHWGKGYGSEALTAVFAFAFEEMKLLSIEADHMGPNISSGRAMEKAGMTYTGTTPGKYSKNGHTYDAPRYRITRDEWVNRR